jgi:hypothetical protein
MYKQGIFMNLLQKLSYYMQTTKALRQFNLRTSTLDAKKPFHNEERLKAH